MSCCCKPYTIFTLIWDLFWICCTGGLWVIWMIIRQSRRNCC